MVIHDLNDLGETPFQETHKWYPMVVKCCSNVDLTNKNGDIMLEYDSMIGTYWDVRFGNLSVSLWRMAMKNRPWGTFRSYVQLPRE